MAAGRMHEVELVEGPGREGPDDDAGPPRAARTRALRVLRRWWPLAAGVVAAVVVAQVVADRRHDTAVEHRRETDGVLLTTPSTPLTAVRWESPDASTLALEGIRTPDGLVAGVVVPAAVGAPVFVAVDPATGSEQWRVAVGDPSPGSGSGGCTLVVEPSPTAWCLLYQAASRDGDAVVLAPRVVEVGLDERAVRGARDLPPDAGVGFAGSVLVVATPGASGTSGTSSTEVQATDLASGVDLWAVALDALPPDGSGVGVGVGVVGGHVLLPGPTGTWVIDPSTGAAQEVDGIPLAVQPDDGTAGDVLLVRREDGTANGVLAALDASTGETLWQRAGRGDPSAQLVLLDGVLYGADGSRMWAVDAVTGAQRWSTATGPEVGELMTDGRSVLRMERDAANGATVLAAYDLGDGRSAWAAPLPDGIAAVWTRAGTLLGQGDDGGVFTLG